MPLKLQAELTDGRKITYIEVEDPPAGTMKKTYFTPDRTQVVQFFMDPTSGNDQNRRARLEAVIGKFNPTLDPTTGEYWKSLFCWPTGIVVKPTMGIVCPAYPTDYFFATGPFSGKEKKGKWFSSPKLRNYLPPVEKGSWINYFMICIKIARAVRRLHSAGLAHSDLSCNNILIDPSKGLSVVIDIDSLVVPGVFPPDVLGTPGYIAPEILRTCRLALTDPKREHPKVATDQHALAVLIYEYLLFRHPLKGPKIHHTSSAEEDDHLAMGEKALFIEHPSDRSNRPQNMPVTIDQFGPYLKDLFIRSFVGGLHTPHTRPAAVEWERALIKTWDLLIPCENTKCSHNWMVVQEKQGQKCPFCGMKPIRKHPVLTLRKQTRPGNWVADGKLAVYHNSPLMGWHVFDNQFPSETANRERYGYFAFHQGKWILVNERLTSLLSSNGNRVAINSATELSEGKQLRLSEESHGRMAETKLC